MHVNLAFLGIVSCKNSQIKEEVKMNIILAGNAVKSKKTKSLKFQHFEIWVDFIFLRTDNKGDEI